jgi:hypothetical protein
MCLIDPPFRGEGGQNGRKPPILLSGTILVILKLLPTDCGNGRNVSKYSGIQPFTPRSAGAFKGVSLHKPYDFYSERV